MITIHKPGKDSALPSSYRPISLLDFLGKILERLLLARLNPLLNSSDRIHYEQFGFKSHHSTKEPLLRLTSFIQEGFQSKEHTVATFLDIEQAFDRVWHGGLIFKLSALQIPDVYIQLIADYLRNRTFRVRHGGFLSDLHRIEAGVPQGSVLAPVLYSIYVQDIPSFPGCQHALYADDTVIYTKDRDIKTAFQRMQIALNILTQWSTKWRLKINGDK